MQTSGEVMGEMWEGAELKNRLRRELGVAKKMG